MSKGGLGKWFGEKWVDVKTGKECGRSGSEKASRSYPACRPAAAAAKMSALLADASLSGDLATSFAIHEVYGNVEQQHFVAVGQMSRRWWSVQQNDSITHLQYVTAGDSAVRPSHAALNGTTLPKTDKFWDTHYPPLGYRCRCTVRSLTLAQFEGLPPNTPTTAPSVAPDAPEFFNNPGSTGKAIGDMHRYFASLSSSDKEQIVKSSQYAAIMAEVAKLPEELQQQAKLFIFPTL
jgi:hypothetical protein